MKKGLKSLLAFALVLVAMVLAPSFVAKAEAPIIYYGPDNLRQTDAKADRTVSFQWDAVAGAAKYYVIASNADGSQYPFDDYVTGTSVSFKADKLTSGGYICVYSVNADGKFYKNAYKKMAYYSMSAAPKTVVLDTYKPSSASFTLKWTGVSYVDGYQVAVYNIAGKKIKTFSTNSMYSTSLTKSLNKIKNKGFRVQVRGYKVLNNYTAYKKTVYGKWTKMKAFTPQPNVTKSTHISKTQTKLTWKKVPNAKSYTVYKVINMSQGKFKKLKTVTGTSAVVPYSNPTDYVVVCTLKVKGKTIESTTLKQSRIGYTHVYTTYTYY